MTEPAAPAEPTGPEVSLPAVSATKRARILRVMELLGQRVRATEIDRILASEFGICQRQARRDKRRALALLAPSDHRRRSRMLAEGIAALRTISIKACAAGEFGPAVAAERALLELATGTASGADLKRITISVGPKPPSES